MRRLTAVSAAVVGAVVGVVATTALRDDPRTAVPPPGAVATIERTPVPTPRAGVLLAWVSNGLPPGFADRVAEATGPTSAVLGDTVWMVGSADGDGRPVDALPAGHAVPLDAMAFDCESWTPFVPLAEATALCTLASDEVLLGATSARLRRLGPGGTIVLDGGRVVRVAGVVADDAVGAAELVLPSSGAAAAGVRTARYVLSRFQGDRAAAEAALRASVGDAAVRVRGPGETPWLRHGDAVLPPSAIKERFGEWSARRIDGGGLELDPGWVAANLVTADLPVLGPTRCHRGVVPALRAALSELADRGSLPGVDRAGAGCWNPRTIAGADAPSRHAWGVAVDIVPPPGDPEVVEVMERWGLTWGGRWLTPDPVHFEFVRTPKA